MMKTLLTVSALAAVTLLGACATYSDEELAAQCPRTDWYAYGLNDGKLGQPVKRATEFFDGCRGLGIQPDVTAYEMGRATGLREFCTAENGYRVGVEGRKYYGVCPADLEPGFKQGLSRGRKDNPDHYYSGRPHYWPYIGIGVGGGYHRHGHVRSGVFIGF